MTAAAASPMFSMMVEAVNKAGLTETLNNTENITVFAPTNDAFAKISTQDLNDIMANQELLNKVLAYHVVPETLTPDKLAGTHETMTGDSLTVTGSGSDFTVNDTAKIVCGNIKTTNATVYAVDSVIIPN
jgi:uncharacterized surface protein with fasciclin (FAS1) repeats